MRNLTFAECFCAKNNIPPEKFAHVVFNRVLYRRTHLFKWLLPVFQPNYFSADFDLILGVQHLRRMRDFVAEAERFNAHPANHGWLRRAFCLRVSTSRLKALIRETLPRKAGHSEPGLPVEDHTGVPFETTTSSGA